MNGRAATESAVRRSVISLNRARLSYLGGSIHSLSRACRTYFPTPAV